MIKSIEFKGKYGNDISIPLTPGVNLIVGPKGGGKSSLLNVLASSEMGFVSKRTKNIFKGNNENPYSLNKVILSSGEEKRFTSMKEELDKEAKKLFDNNMNIISQNDSVKSDLLEAKDVAKKTKDILKKYIEQSTEFDELYKLIVSFKEFLEKIVDAGRKTIYWENISKISCSKKTSNLLLKLNYSKTEILSKIRKEQVVVTDRMSLLEQTFNRLKQTSSQIDESKFIGNEFKKTSKDFQEKWEKESKRLIELSNKELFNMEKYAKAANSFDIAYTKKTDELKAQDFQKNGIDQFKIKSTAHFREMGRMLKDSKKIFNNIMTEKFIISVSMKQEEELLSFRLDDNININEEQMINIMKTLVYSSNTKTEIGKWIEQAVKKGFPEAQRKTFDKAILNLLMTKIKVFAGEKEYVNMSPGQKSIFGIKYKMSKAEGSTLFLDQPEDNLDNHTIATEILNMINNSGAEQIFIVTHNANIGILTSPQNVIVANLADEDVPYLIGSIKGVEDNPQAYYLEGGSQYLKQRWEKIGGQ